MPSYLVSAKESFVPVELYKAPVDALGETMRIKQQQYDQAFNQIAAAKSSMEGLEVLGDDVRMLKQKYLADAANKLKNLASVDLSIPQNVSEAQKVFEPFYSDQVLMANAGRTAFNSQQLQALDTMQNSKDETIRSGYHPALKEYLLNDRKKIADAGLDPAAYNSFQYRKATPFIDQQKFLQEAAKAEGLKVVNTIEKGPQLIEIENGKPSLKNYQAWAASKLNDTRFNEQYMILGTVQQERNYANLRANPIYANYSDDDLKKIHADRVAKELETSYTQREQSLTTRNKAIETELSTLVVPQGAPTNQMEANALLKFQALKQEYSENQDMLTGILSDKANNRTEETRNMLMVNPGAYYASLARNADIMNFAAGRASMESVKISKNDNYWMDIQAQQKWKEIAQKDEEIQLRKEGKWDSKSSSTSTDGSSSSTTTAGGPSGAVSLGATSVGTEGNKTTPYELYNSFLRQQLDIHGNAIWDPTNGMMSVVSALGIPGEEVVAAATGFMKKSKDVTYQMTPQEKTAADKIEKELERVTGVNITGPGTFTNALYAYTNKYLEGAGKDRPYTQNDYKLFMAYANAHKTGQTIQAYADEENRIINDIISTDPKFSKLLVTDGDKKRMVKADDISAVLAPVVDYFDSKTNSWKPASQAVKEQLGENFIATGKPVNYDLRMKGTSSGAVEKVVDLESGHVVVNGQKVPVRFNSPQEQTAVMKALTDRFGNPAQLGALLKEARSKVVPNEEYFAGMQGQMTPRIGFPFDERATVRQETGVRILQELTIPESVANYYAYNVANNQKEKLSAESMAALQNVLKGGEDTIQKYFGTPTYDPYASKNGRVVTTLKPTLSDKELEEAGLKDWKGKDIVFELNNISTVGPTLKDIRVGQQFYVWKDILDGKPIQSPEIMRNGLKFGFKIVPTRSDSSAAEAYTEFTYPVWNAQQGTFEVKTMTTPNYPIKGDGAVDPDTRLNMTYAELFKQISAVTSMKLSQGGVNGLDLLKR